MAWRVERFVSIHSIFIMWRDRILYRITLTLSSVSLLIWALIVPAISNRRHCESQVKSLATLSFVRGMNGTVPH
jgi:hypothetical protein